MLEAYDVQGKGGARAELILQAVTFRLARKSMNQKNLLRVAVENRKRQLIRLLETNRATEEPGKLKQWTLSELENEWKRCQKDRATDIG